MSLSMQRRRPECFSSVNVTQVCFQLHDYTRISWKQVLLVQPLGVVLHNHTVSLSWVGICGHESRILDSQRSVDEHYCPSSLREVWWPFYPKLVHKMLSISPSYDLFSLPKNIGCREPRSSTWVIRIMTGPLNSNHSVTVENDTLCPFT